MKFDKNYTKYWSSAIKKSVDGTIIAGEIEAKSMIKHLQLKREDTVLDLGCSFGRMHKAIYHYSDKIYGVDVDPYAVKEASKLPYIDVRVGSGENTNFEDESFDAIFCWAVFELINHKEGFIEINRNLKRDGKILLTGKNNNYFKDDKLAFNAEKNAFLKGFPNRFTDLGAVVKNMNILGFEVDKIFIFENRGDMGIGKYINYGQQLEDKYLGYEYLLISRKIGKPKISRLNSLKLEYPNSNTALELARVNGFNRVEDFFHSLGIN